MLQLNPSIPVNTPTGQGRAILVINHGTSLPLEWIVINATTTEFESWRTQDLIPIISEPAKLLQPESPLPSSVGAAGAPSSFTTGQSQTLVI